MNLQLKYTVAEDGTKSVTIPDDRRAFVIDFVRQNAMKSPREMEAIVQEGHEKLLAALDGVSEAQAAHKPGPRDWSILELLAHVVTIKRVMGALATNLSAGNLPPGFGPQFEEASAQDGVAIGSFGTLDEARAALQTPHDELIAFIRALDNGANGDVNLEKTFKHFLFGTFNCREWAIFQRVHDEDHTPQIAAIKAFAGYPA